MKAFFGPEGKRSLALAKFAQCLTALHDEVVRLEFCHYAGANEVRPEAQCSAGLAGVLAAALTCVGSPSQALAGMHLDSCRAKLCRVHNYLGIATAWLHGMPCRVEARPSGSVPTVPRTACTHAVCLKLHSVL